MEYLERPPHPELNGVVRTYWWLRGDAEQGVAADPALPDGSPELIFNLGAPWEQRAVDGAAVRQPAAFLVGQLTGPMIVRPTGRIDLVCVRLEAHAAVLLCADVRALTDAWVPVEWLRASAQPTLRALRAALALTSAVDAQLRAIDAALRALLAIGPLPDALVGEAVGAIRGAHGAVDIEGLARALGVTPRTLQRRFAAATALSPKQLARIVRFQRVFAAWRADPMSLSRVALECGYFDQSHLVRDFRDFAGAPPAGFLAALPAFTAFFTSARGVRRAHG